MTNAHQVLGVPYNAPPEVIKAAYRKLARTYHPDVDKSPSATRRMAAINAAYAELRRDGRPSLRIPAEGIFVEFEGTEAVAAVFGGLLDALLGGGLSRMFDTAARMKEEELRRRHHGHTRNPPRAKSTKKAKQKRGKKVVLGPKRPRSGGRK